MHSRPFFLVFFYTITSPVYSLAPDIYRMPSSIPRFPFFFLRPISSFIMFFLNSLLLLSSCCLLSPSFIPFSLPSCICFFCVTFCLNALFLYLYLPVFLLRLHIFRKLFFHLRLLLSVTLLFMFAFFLPLSSPAA